MGDTDTPEPYESLESQWASLLGFADRYRNLGYGPLADALREGGPPPPRVQGTPIIFDTRLGGDPGDAIALTCAARNLPELALVVTTDEHRGDDRARLARYVLDLNDRSDVPVVTGADLGNISYWVTDGFTPQQIPTQPDDLLTAVRAVCSRVDTPVRWIGTGPLTNLSYVLENAPELASQLAITQTGGAIPDGDRAERNFGLDPGAARRVVGAAQRLLLVTAEVSSRPETAVTPDSDLYQHLARPDAPAWARLLHTHFDRWYIESGPPSTQNAALTLGAALQLPFIDFTRASLTVDTDARIRIDAAGDPTWITTRADYPTFWGWLTKQLHY
ncbi:inosine-uridine nucleoside N-ribohydrolase [Nocardia tenerifensis]|uniref:Inosine-uridine nucleoside N-ribohydrolase n=1 Tax=Nocardia tenerifensis TaxID=228006 RepID=A0A318KFN0_9NOCA|nr:nucleoside hydrolase [Nocardia tenerifensis]PXX71639.1 inosine-uridine nucleoside N-ribohydrolase [Nocardia tenerifensis]